ncbi:MAG: PAS domain-containing protein [Calothrix sp. C42_A2020_038]|nr:PAS domain-containing protein [Calothrix sp. C42_A2020_038]
MLSMLPGANILLVNNNIDMHDDLQRILSLRWCVEVVNDEQALKSINEHLPDIVVIGRIHRTNTLPLLREIRTNQKISIPILVITAPTDEEAAINSLIEGADDFIVEPFEAHELITRVAARLQVSQIRKYNRRVISESEERYRKLYDVLQKNTEQLSLAQRAARIGLWSYELTTDIGFVTDEWRHLMGYTADEESWSFIRFLACVHPEDQNRVKIAHLKALNTESGLDVEFRINHAEKGELWILSRAQYIPASEENKAPRLLGYIIDITERKKFEKELHLSQKRYQCLKMVTTAIVWTAAPDGRILEDLPMWEAFTGQTPAEYKEYGWLNALHPDDRDPTLSLWIDALEIKHPIEVLFRLRLRDGRYQQMLAFGLPVFDFNENVCEWVGTFTII